MNAAVAQKHKRMRVLLMLYTFVARYENPSSKNRKVNKVLFTARFTLAVILAPI